jgi:hypothetical protein
VLFRCLDGFGASFLELALRFGRSIPWLRRRAGESGNRGRQSEQQPVTAERAENAEKTWLGEILNIFLGDLGGR